MASIVDRIKSKNLLADTSLWSAPLTDIDKGIALTENFTDLYHIDVADAHFAPTLLFFPDLVAAINKRTEKPIHVHLMMDDPLTLLDDFVDAGADIVTVHAELGGKIGAIIARLKERGVGVGLAVKVESDLSVLGDYLDELDVVVVMGTRIGIKGVGLEPTTTDRIRALRRKLDGRGTKRSTLISVDGGIRKETVPALRGAGADIVTPGSLVFKSADIPATFQWLKSLPID
jgi:ribulose-phosphate 3-epimerase